MRHLIVGTTDKERSQPREKSPAPMATTCSLVNSMLVSLKMRPGMRTLVYKNGPSKHRSLSTLEHDREAMSL